MEQEGIVVEMGVKKDSLMPPTVTSTTSSKSPTEPEGDRKSSVLQWYLAPTLQLDRSTHLIPDIRSNALLLVRV